MRSRCAAGGLSPSLNAAALLSETNMRVSDVSEMVGFTDYNYFSRVFKKYKALSPSEYRKANPGK